MLRVPQSTLNYWLEGGTRREKTYQPMIRPESKGGRAPVTWAESIEAGLLRSYRRDLGVRMAKLRTFIDDLRNRLGVPYPLADRRPYVSGRQLLLDAHSLEVYRMSSKHAVENSATTRFAAPKASCNLVRKFSPGAQSQQSSSTV